MTYEQYGSSGTRSAQPRARARANVREQLLRHDGPGLGGRRRVFSWGRIEKGALATNLEAGNVGLFKEGRAWRRFVVTLTWETMCNFIEWC